jgi:hypothetical protein
MFELSDEDTQAQVNALLARVNGWKTLFAGHSIEQRSLDMPDEAILPASVFQARAL